MLQDAPENARDALDAIYRKESRRVLATLVRLVGDFDLAEEALHDAVIAAMEQWPRDGVPTKPTAWLVSTGRFKAIDRLRRRAKFNASLDDAAENLQTEAIDPAQWDDEHLEDDQLRLIFTCCHPALPQEAQLALTLREVCGLTTEEIARSFLTSAPTIAKRIVRAKSKIRDARIPYEVPASGDLADRLDSVLHVIYLIFTEGYSASSGESLVRSDLSAEAIRLGRILAEMMPEPETLGLLGLMLLQESRRAARTSANSEVILLDEQDRSLWNRSLIEEGTALVQRALGTRPAGQYALQAAIAAVHAEAETARSTDWTEIVGLYDALLQVSPTPVVELNRAVAIAMRDGAAVGLAVVESILARGELDDYYLAHAARADLCRRLDRTEEAADSYRRALSLARQEPSRRFLERRLREMTK